MSPPRPSARTLAAARLRRAICEAGLTQHEAGQLVGVDARQVRRWLSRDVSLGALELLCEIQERSPGLYPVMDARGADPRASTRTSGFPGDSQPRKRAGNPGANDERSLKLVEQARAVVTAGETALFTALTEGSRSPVNGSEPLADRLDDSVANSCGTESLPHLARKEAA